MKIVDGKTECLAPPASQGPLCVSCQPYGKFDATSLHVPANSKGRYLHYHPKVWIHDRIVWVVFPLRTLTVSWLLGFGFAVGHACN
jgi:hypothetical protein